MNALLTLGIVVYSIVCVLLVLIIIIQGGKAEGLFSSAQSNVLGSQRGNALSKATAFLSAVFVAGALLISLAISTKKTAFDNVNISNNNTKQQTSAPAASSANNITELTNTESLSN